MVRMLRAVKWRNCENVSVELWSGGPVVATLQACVYSYNQVCLIIFQVCRQVTNNWRHRVMTACRITRCTSSRCTTCWWIVEKWRSCDLTGCNLHCTRSHNLHFPSTSSLYKISNHKMLKMYNSDRWKAISVIKLLQ